MPPDLIEEQNQHNGQPAWREFWRPHQLTPAEYRTRFIDPTWTSTRTGTPKDRWRGPVVPEGDLLHSARLYRQQRSAHSHVIDNRCGLVTCGPVPLPFIAKVRRRLRLHR